MKSLTFSGSGVYVYCQLGFLHRLKELNLLHRVDTIVGSSMGSVVGFLFFIGYSPSEMLSVFDQMTDACFSLDKDLVADYGCDDGRRLMQVIEKAAQRKNVDANVTFDELYKRFGKRLIVTGSNVTKGVSEYFHHETARDMPIVDALRISISLPALFTPVLYRGDYFVDGSIFDHYPSLYMEKDLLNRTAVDPQAGDMAGISIDFPVKYTIDNFVHLTLHTFFNCMKRQTKHGNAYTIRVPWVNVDPLDFSLSTEDRRRLFRCGYQQTESGLHRMHI